MFFGTLEEQAGTEIDWKSLYEKTINHDFAEVFIGDIKTPVKHASPELKSMLAHVEEKMMEKSIVEEIPEQKYNTEAHTPKPEIMYDGKVLVENVDYVLTYENNVNIEKFIESICNISPSKDYVYTFYYNDLY